MGLTDGLNYVLFDNPISHGLIGATKMVVKPIIKTAGSLTGKSQAPLQIVTKSEPLYILALQNGPILKVAGLSGSIAVALAAYGAHRKYPKDNIAELKAIFENGNKIHFYHSLALLGVPLSRSPKVAGTLFVLGTILFSGPCYYHAITGENKFGKFAPVGGTVLILAWLSLVF